MVLGFTDTCYFPPATIRSAGPTHANGDIGQRMATRVGAQRSGMAVLGALAHYNFVFLKPERSVEVARDVVAGSDMEGNAS